MIKKAHEKISEMYAVSIRSKCVIKVCEQKFPFSHFHRSQVLNGVEYIINFQKIKKCLLYIIFIIPTH